MPAPYPAKDLEGPLASSWMYAFPQGLCGDGRRNQLARGAAALPVGRSARYAKPDGTIGLFTTGLGPLGHMEIEIPRIDMPAGVLREWLVNIMYYLLENGPVLKHGQTIGMSAEQKIRISHSPSRFGHRGKVIRLER